MNKAAEQSIKHKLKDISKTLRVPFNSLLEILFLERFLVRVMKSSYADKLIFKGGMCLAQLLDLGRKTKDIDFLFTQIKNNIGKINLYNLKKNHQPSKAIDKRRDTFRKISSAFFGKITK